MNIEIWILHQVIYINWGDLVYFMEHETFHVCSSDYLTHGVLDDVAVIFNMSILNTILGLIPWVVK